MPTENVAEINNNVSGQVSLAFVTRHGGNKKTMKDYMTLLHSIL